MSDRTISEQAQRVLDRLESAGAETPHKFTGEDPGSKQRRIEEKFLEIMEVLGLDLGDDSLRETPARVARMFVSEVFSGLDYHNFPKVLLLDNKFGLDEMVVESRIAVKSFCEHHFVPIKGFATVGYLPGRYVVGLSKLNRIVDFFSRRPQVQERLTQQIYLALSELLETKDVAVSITADHLCVSHRGVEDVDSMTTTNKFGGAFLFGHPSARAEFLALAAMNRGGKI